MNLFTETVYNYYYICDLNCYKGVLLAKHLWPDVWKGTTVKTSQQPVLCTYSCYIYTVIHGNHMYTKLFLMWYNSGPFSQIKSQTFWQKWSLILNQVTYNIQCWVTQTVNIGIEIVTKTQDRQSQWLNYRIGHGTEYAIIFLHFIGYHKVLVHKTIHYLKTLL